MRKRALLLAISAGFAGCAATKREAPPVQTPAPPAPEAPAPLVRDPNETEVRNDARTPPPVKKTDPQADHVVLNGPKSQGGFLIGSTLPGTRLTLDGETVAVDPAGRFGLGFGRDHGAKAVLKAAYPDGKTETLAITVAKRAFSIEKIDGVDQSKVSGFTPEQLAKIQADTAEKAKARETTENQALFADGFSWPATGRISGVFGSQRILNGEAKTPHSGLDIAAPTGTPIKAPAAGVVRLADQNMYFEGGLVLLDHGLSVESAFLHMSRIDVKPGQRVEKGDILGAVGGTGRATGPHLHWSIRWKSHLVDPQLLVDPAANPEGGALSRLVRSDTTVQ